MRIIKKQVAPVLLAVMIAVIAGPASGQICVPAYPCGDVNEANGVTAADALGVLRRAIELPVNLTCSCNGGAQCEESGTVQTGQTMCWDPLDTVNPIDPIDCIGTGQDGDFQRGVASSYVDNGDGTVSDLRTALMWEKLADDGAIHDWDNFAYQWAGAYGKIADLNTAAFAGYDDWRLPNVRELATLIDFSAYRPPVDIVFNDECVPGCTVLECSCTKIASYWSSTTYQNTPTAAWYVGFVNGIVTTTTKTNLYYVRAVRAGY